MICTRMPVRRVARGRRRTSCCGLLVKKTLDAASSPPVISLCAPRLSSSIVAPSASMASPAHASRCLVGHGMASAARPSTSRRLTASKGLARHFANGRQCSGQFQSARHEIDAWHWDRSPGHLPTWVGCKMAGYQQASLIGSGQLWFNWVGSAKGRQPCVGSAEVGASQDGKSWVGSGWLNERSTVGIRIGRDSGRRVHSNRWQGVGFQDYGRIASGRIGSGGIGKRPAVSRRQTTCIKSQSVSGRPRVDSR